jgi:hypothetical protein
MGGAMSSIVISGDTSGTITVAAPAVSGTNTITLPAGTGTVAVQGASTNIVSGTAVASTSGTSITFTGIPSWAKRITVMFNNVSTNGTNHYIIQIGSGSVTTTGYASGGSYQGASEAGYNSITSGFATVVGPGTSTLVSGHATITNISGNTWVHSAVLARTTESYTQLGGGVITLSGTLDRVVVTTNGGTDTFDAGSINILYE